LPVRAGLSVSGEAKNCEKFGSWADAKRVVPSSNTKQKSFLIISYKLKLQIKPESFEKERLRIEF
jgi:hypothetical protein